MQNIHKQTKLFIDNIEITEICFYTLKKSKSNYYNQYFRANMNNVKNTWKEIIYIYIYIYIYITIQNLSSDIPKSLSYNGSTITNKVEISNIFNNYFATIAEKVKVNINLSHKNKSDFLKSRNQNSFSKSYQ